MVDLHKIIKGLIALALILIALGAVETYAEMQIQYFFPGDNSFVNGDDVGFSITVLNTTPTSADNATFKMANATLIFETCEDTEATVEPGPDDSSNYTSLFCTWDSNEATDMLYDNVSVEIKNTTHNIIEYNYNITVDNILPEINQVTVTNNGSISPSSLSRISANMSDNNWILYHGINILDDQLESGQGRYIHIFYNYTSSPTNGYVVNRTWDGSGFKFTSNLQETQDVISVMELILPSYNSILLVSGWFNGSIRATAAFDKTNLNLLSINDSDGILPIVDGESTFRVINYNSSRYDINDTSSITLYASSTSLKKIPANDTHTFTIEFEATDIAGLTTFYDYNNTVISIPPMWSKNKTSPAHPATYGPGKNYWFNITWEDSALDTVIFEFNGTNYTNAVKENNEYYKQLTDLAAGTYTYRWFANDSKNNWNLTGNMSYVINKNSTNSLSLSASPGWSVTDGTSTTVTCSNNNDKVTHTLHKGYSPVGNPHQAGLPVGTHYYNCNTTETQNYTSFNVGQTLSVTTGGGGGNQGGGGNTGPGITGVKGGGSGFFEIANLVSPVIVAAGGEKQFTFNLKNGLKESMVDIEVSLEGLDSEWFTLDKTRVSRIDAGSTAPITVTLKPPVTAIVKDYSVEIKSFGYDQDRVLKKKAIGGVLTIKVTVAGSAPENENIEGNETVGNTTAGPAGYFLGLPYNIWAVIAVIIVAIAVVLYKFKDQVLEKLKELTEKAKSIKLPRSEKSEYGVAG